MAETTSISSEISKFISFIEQCKTDYEQSSDLVKEMDKLTQDYLHKLELNDKACRERSKTSTALAKCRKDRRQNKDIAEEINPVIEWLENPNTIKVLNKLKETLGTVRNKEKYHEKRQYYHRVLKDGDMQ